jgi:hypothetical protein
MKKYTLHYIRVFNNGIAQKAETIKRNIIRETLLSTLILMQEIIGKNFDKKVIAGTKATSRKKRHTFIQAPTMQ